MAFLTVHVPKVAYSDASQGVEFRLKLDVCPKNEFKRIYYMMYNAPQTSVTETCMPEGFNLWKQTVSQMTKLPSM